MIRRQDRVVKITVLGANDRVFEVDEEAISRTGTHTVLNIKSQGYKKSFMLNSAEHEILNAHKYKNIK